MAQVGLGRFTGLALVLLVALLLLGMPIVAAVGAEPNVGKLEVARVEHPSQVAPSAQFSLIIDVEYAIRFNATVKSALFQGSEGNLSSELWHSDQLVLRGGGDKLWTVNLTAPSTEQNWVLTVFAYYFEDDKWQYYTDDYRGPGFAEVNIKVAKLATLEIDLGVPNVTVKVDNASDTTSNIGNVSVELLIGRVHEVSVPLFLPFENSTRLVFSMWEDGVNATQRSLLLEGESRLVGFYKMQYLLRVDSIVSDYSQSVWYDVEANASLRVESSVPMNGPLGFLGGRFVFTDWTGDIESRSTSINVTIDKPKVINANFVADYTSLVIPAVLAVGIIGGIVLVALRRRRTTKPGAVEEPAAGETAEAKVCDDCGEPVEEDWVYCVHCGKALRSPEPVQD
jgi:hypothetical protein